MKITDEARDFIQSVLREQNAKGIRLLHAGVGWGGPKIDVSLDEPHENDIVETINGIQVAFDQPIYEILENSSLHLQKTPYGEGITLVADNASSC